MSNAIHTVPLADAPWSGGHRPAEVRDLGVPVRQALDRTVFRSPGTTRVLSCREAWLLGAFALVLHGAVLHWLS
ncbi:energy transducer TonB, partial [Pseudomonas sp. MAHUQ-62]